MRPTYYFFMEFDDRTPQALVKKCSTDGDAHVLAIQLQKIPDLKHIKVRQNYDIIYEAHKRS